MNFFQHIAAEDEIKAGGGVVFYLVAHAFGHMPHIRLLSRAAGIDAGAQVGGAGAVGDGQAGIIGPERIENVIG